MISNALEEYLKNIYVLKKQNGNIRVTDIANKMNCSKASVNKAINILKANNLINYETYGKIDLTKIGEDHAKKLLETYDIVYLFFKDVLNLEEEIAKQEAEKVKLVISDDTVNSLARYTHKVLDLYNLDCNYDVNQERCRSCLRRTERGELKHE